MRRRSFLTTAPALGVGAAGCSIIATSEKTYRVWFIRIHNGSSRQLRVDLRLFRENELIFENRLEGINSFQETREREASFAKMDSARLVEGEWEITKGSHRIEYRLSDQDAFTETDVGGIEDFESEDIAINMQILGGRMTSPKAALEIYPFTSRKQAADFLEDVS